MLGAYCLNRVACIVGKALEQLNWKAMPSGQIATLPNWVLKSPGRVVGKLHVCGGLRPSLGVPLSQGS
jgi:hypothetical protein